MTAKQTDRKRTHASQARQAPIHTSGPIPSTSRRGITNQVHRTLPKAAIPTKTCIHRLKSRQIVAIPVDCRMSDVPANPSEYLSLVGKGKPSSYKYPGTNHPALLSQHPPQVPEAPIPVLGRGSHENKPNKSEQKTTTPLPFL